MKCCISWTVNPKDAVDNFLDTVDEGFAVVVPYEQATGHFNSMVGFDLNAIKGVML